MYIYRLSRLEMIPFPVKYISWRRRRSEHRLEEACEHIIRYISVSQTVGPVSIFGGFREKFFQLYIDCID